MSTYTNWYHLDKYEGQDKPNLLDQYNSAMDKVDSALHQIAESGGGSIPSDITQRVADLEQDVSTLQRNVLDINNNITSLENKVSSPIYNPYEGTNIVFIGDSYTYGTGASDHGGAEIMRFSGRLCSMLSANEFNFGIGSTGFCDPGSGGQNTTFAQQIAGAVSSMDEAERNRVSVVIIAGGINDAHDATEYSYNQMYTAAGECVLRAQLGFKNAKILVVPMLWKGYNFSNRAENYYNAIIEGVKHVVGNERKKVAYMQGCYTWNWGDSTHFNSDKLHPNDDGYQVIANNIYSALMSEQYIIWENKVYNITYASSGNFEGGENSDNQIILREGIVYIPALRIKALAAVNTNTAFGTFPRSLTPRTNAYAQINHANQVYGTYSATASHTFYCNPHLNALAANDEFYCTPLAFKVYGEDYNQ